MGREPVFIKVRIQLYRMFRDHMQLIRQGIQLSYNALKLIRKIAMLLLHLFMPVFMVLVRMSQGLDLGARSSAQRTAIDYIYVYTLKR